MKAKFELKRVTPFCNSNNSTVCEHFRFEAVTSAPFDSDGNSEDNDFARWTPSGTLEMSVSNPNLFGKFVAGDRFYLHFIPVDATPKVEGLTFGEALEALKQGKRIAREGWNGKGMFLFLLPSGTVPTKAIHDPALRDVIESNVGGDTFEALGSIRMFTADRKILTGWLASQTDMLADDWTILPS